MNAWNADFFALRTPLMPIESAKKFLKDHTDPERLVGACLKDQLFMEALYFASPGLWRRLTSASGKGEPLVEFAHSVIKYKLRMSLRPTPFGGFSGISSGNVARSTAASLELDSIDTHKKRVFLNLHFLDLLQELGKDEELRTGELKVTANDTIVVAPTRIHYSEIRIKNRNDIGEFGSVERNEILDELLSRCRRPTAVRLLRKWLVAKGAEEMEASLFIEELIRQNLIVPETRTSLTFCLDRQFEETRRLLEKAPSLAGYADLTKKIGDLRLKFDGTAPGASYGDCLRLSEEITPLMRRNEKLKDFDEPLFRADLVKSSRNLSLPHTVVRDCRKAVELLGGLFDVEPSEELGFFKKEFERRYGDRLVPMLEALDPDMGIGFGRDHDHESKPKRWNSKAAATAALENFFVRKYEEALLHGKSEIALKEQELAPFLSVNSKLPETFAVIASLSARSMSDVTKGDYLVTIGAVTGNPATALLGRFCAADDSLSENVVRFHAAEAKLHRDAVTAEIVFKPRTKIANVLTRPAPRRHEIPVMSRSGVAADKRISLQDLLLTVKDGELVLISRRLRKRILPRLTNGHNFSTCSVPIYRFLCQLQNQGRNAFLSFQIEPLSWMAYLPRIRMGRIILSLAQWRFAGDEIASLRSDFLKFKEKWRIPDEFALMQDDQALPVFSQNPVSLAAFLDTIKSKTSLLLRELDPSWAVSPVRGPEGSFANEFVIPFIRENKESRRDSGFVMPSVETGTAAHLPGSEWLYLKIFGGMHHLEHVLLNDLLPEIERLKKRGLVRESFFIRYGEPDYHLRLRLRLKAGSLSSKVFDGIRRKLSRHINDGSVWSVDLSTYLPERERYGGDKLFPFSERLFSADSETVLAVLNSIKDSKFETAERWKVGVMNILSWFEFFEMSDIEASEFSSSLAKSFPARPDWNKRLSRKRRFGDDREFLKECAANDNAKKFGFERREKLFEDRKDFLKKLKKHPRRRAIMQSHIHVSLNRLFMNHTHEVEADLYDFSRRILAARAATGKCK